MRIRIAHETAYRYESAAKSVVQVLRLTPRSHEGQHVARWRIDLSHDARLTEREDAFGNLTHVFSLSGPVSDLSVSVEGEVECFDTAGVVRGTIERFPPSLFLRETPLTHCDRALTAFAETATGSNQDPLDTCHALMSAIHREMVFDSDPTHSGTTAAQSFALRRGVCQDLTHVFIACARARRVPARYVGGHMVRRDGVMELDAGHAWAEAHVPGLGWVGFDTANNICPSDAHLRIAVGLDYLGAAPVRGVQMGGAGERMAVAVDVREERAAERRQVQWQGQA